MKDGWWIVRPKKESDRRQPPLLGATGIDFGAKSAISLVLPKKKPQLLYTEESCTCYNSYGDFWGFYDQPATGTTWWRHWCNRCITFDFGPADNPVDSTVDNCQGFYLGKIVENCGPGGGFGGDPCCTPPEENMIDFWFVPTGEAVTDLLADAGVFVDGPVHILLNLEMFREVYRGYDPTDPLARTPVNPSETSSIPRVETICITPL